MDLILGPKPTKSHVGLKTKNTKSLTINLISSMTLQIRNTGCPINMETHSTLIFSFCISATGKVKPLLKNLDPNLQGATLILIFFKKLDYFLGSTKKKQNEKFFGAMPPPPFFKMSQDFVFSDLCFFFKSMYPGTRVHGILFFLQNHVPRFMNLRKQNLGTF